MTPFHGVAAFYRQYRSGLPASVTDILDAAVDHRSPRRLLDIGTGTGQVVKSMMGKFDDIIAIDPDREMLAAAEEALRPQVRDGIKLVLHASKGETYKPPFGWYADLVTICRTFHWLNQAVVLDRLDSQVSTRGAVAILGDSSFWNGADEWKVAVRSVIQDFLGEQRRAGSGVFQHHDRSYAEILRESAFSQVEEFTVPVEQRYTADKILGYLYSTSFASPHLFGGAVEEFDQAVRKTLAGLSNEDLYIDRNKFVIRIARRAPK